MSIPSLNSTTANSNASITNLSGTSNTSASAISYVGSSLYGMFSMIFQSFNCCRKKTLAVSHSSVQPSPKTKLFVRKIAAFSFTSSAYSSASSISSSSASLNKTSVRPMHSAVIVNDEKTTTTPAEEDPDKTPIAEDDEFYGDENGYYYYVNENGTKTKDEFLHRENDGNFYSYDVLCNEEFIVDKSSVAKSS